MSNTNTTKKIIETEFKATLAGAVEACLWSTTPTPADDSDMDLTEPADQYAITEQELNKLRGTLAHHMAGWFTENYFTICPVISAGYTWYDVGHDFWLTSQGHGAGFWDRGFEEVGDALTDSVDGYEGIIDLYLNEDATHVQVDPYNVNTFTTDLFPSND